MSAKATLFRTVRAIALGVSTAVVGTLISQSSLAGFPYGAILGLGIVLWAAWSLRGYSSRAAGWLYTFVLAGSVTYIALPHDDVMLPANLSGYLFSFGSVAVGMLITSFPKFSR